MKLSLMLEEISSFIVSKTNETGFLDMEIEFLETDSRKIKNGSLFIAIQGHVSDGHDYIKTALEKGAKAIVAERIPESLKGDDGVSRIILVKNTRKALAYIAAKFYGNPSKDMVLIGITGTNGKTTTSYLLESIFLACGFVPGVMGTINTRYQGMEFPNLTTTLDSLSIQKYLAQMKQAGVTHVIMEASSHGIQQHRLDSCAFDLVIFTNLTQDHLDYHQDMESYFEAKKELFTRVMQEQSTVKSGLAVINQDHEYGKKLIKEINVPLYTVSTKNPESSLYSDNIKQNIEGISFAFKEGENLVSGFQSSLTGSFNLENILCAAAASRALGVDFEYIKKGLFDCRIVPGRLEKVENEIGRHIFVDYAHTPDALKNVLTTLKHSGLCRLICVVGCGGDRDKTKRSIMGKIALEYSDVAIITSDNPRTEKPDLIIQDVVKDLPSELLLQPGSISYEAKGYLVEIDREKALNLAVNISKKTDIILAAGKGHEDYQIIGTDKIHFDDAEQLFLACKKYQEKQIVPIPWSIGDIAEAIGKQPTNKILDRDKSFKSISIDSRNINEDQIFVAIKGDKFDAHSFIDQVLDKGVSALLIEESFCLPSDIKDNPSVSVFQVADTVNALGKLAHFQRVRSGVKVVAITGSNGKTSTKTIIQKILARKFPTLATKGNLNNEIGVPMTLLGLSHSHKWAVVEMGMNHPGEISRLSAIAKPDIAVITNTGAAHLEGLGTVENVAKAKAEIFEHVNENAVAVLPAKDGQKQILSQMAMDNPNICKIAFFGDHEPESIYAQNIKIIGDVCKFDVVEKDQKNSVILHSLCQFMVNNALAAIAVGRIAGIEMGVVCKGVEQFRPVPGRMNLIVLPNKINIIDDTYNANPKSMTAALTTLASKAGNHPCCAVLGDMGELGSHSNQSHYDLGRIAVMAGVARLFLFGEMVELTRKGAIDNGLSRDNIFWGSKEDIALKLLDCLIPNQWVLVKGSRIMAMETVIIQLKDIIDEKMKDGTNKSLSRGHNAV